MPPAFLPPDFVPSLWAKIQRNCDISLPVYYWNISDETFQDLERFIGQIVRSERNSYWIVSNDYNDINPDYARLFLTWISEHYRRNGHFPTRHSDPNDEAIATKYINLCEFRQNDWSAWIDRAERALGRNAIYVGKDKRNYVARIQREAGILRKSFDGYTSGGFNEDDKKGSYWSTIVELWDRLDYSEHQLMQWEIGKDWYNREPSARAGGEGFYSQFYECSLLFLRNLSQVMQRNPSLSNDPQRLSEKLTQWVDPSDGLINFLTDICGEVATTRKRSAVSTWEPKVNRYLYLGGAGANVCTRLRSPTQLPISSRPELKDLGGDRLSLKAYGDVAEYDLGQYFTTSGRAYQATADQYMLPLEAVRVSLQGKEGTLESMLLDPLPEEHPWVFVLDSSEVVESWKLVEDVQGKFPIIVSLLQTQLKSVPSDAVSFDLIQHGLQPRICLRFETLAEFQDSGIEMVRGAGRSLQLVPTPPKQPLQVRWNDRVVPVSMGIPRVVTGARGIIEGCSTAKGEYVAVDPNLNDVQCGYYRVRSGNEVGPSMRLAIFPKSFTYDSINVSANSIIVSFTGIDPAPQPASELIDGMWKNVRYGSFLEYSFGQDIQLNIPAPVPGIGWSYQDGSPVSTKIIAYSVDSNISLRFDVHCNPAILKLFLTLSEPTNNGVPLIDSMPIEIQYNSRLGENRISGNLPLASIGDGMIQAMLSISNHQDVRVKIRGVLQYEGIDHIAIPELIVTRHVHDPDYFSSKEFFMASPLNPEGIEDLLISTDKDGVWFPIPSITFNGKKIWDRIHRTGQSVLNIKNLRYSSGTLFDILTTHNPNTFMEALLARFEMGLEDDEWTLIESTFQLIRERNVPLVSLWLPQAVLRHDRTVCKLFERQRQNHLHRWVIQSSKGQFGTFGFDLRLVRVGVIEALPPAFRQDLWSEVHLMNGNSNLIDVDISELTKRKWLANPETSHNHFMLQERWERLYECGDSSVLEMNSATYSKWKSDNSYQCDTWDKQRGPLLSTLPFNDGTVDFDFASEEFSTWTGFENAWNRDPRVLIPTWIKATKWLGWFTVHATDEQYRLLLPFALKSMKMLEATDPQWFKAAFQIAQAQAFI